MSSPTPRRVPERQLESEPEHKGPNLFVLYGLLALGILVAMAFGAMIVWPFYLRR